MTRCAHAANDARRLIARSGGWARAAGLLLAVLGLAAILARSAGPAPAALSVIAHYALFAAGVTVLLHPQPRAGRSARRWAAAGLGAAVLATGAALLPGAWGRLAVTGFGAAVEEYVFRREVPRAFAAGVAGRGTVSGVVALLLVQALFAACHFVPHAPLAAAPFARLLAAGLFLSFSYRASGTLLAPVALHTLINSQLLGISSGIL